MRILILLAALLCACQPKPDFYVDGIGVKIETNVEWANAPDFDTHFRNIVYPALAHFEGGYQDIEGWVIVIKDGGVNCGKTALGCAQYWRSTIFVSTANFCLKPGCGISPNLESTVLAHEVGHTVIHDDCHRDIRWTNWDDVIEALPWEYQTWWLGSVWQTQPTC